VVVTVLHSCVTTATLCSTKEEHEDAQEEHKIEHATNANDASLGLP
jgi:hypothetical protein